MGRKKKVVEKEELPSWERAQLIAEEESRRLYNEKLRAVKEFVANNQYGLEACVSRVNHKAEYFVGIRQYVAVCFHDDGKAYYNEFDEYELETKQCDDKGVVIYSVMRKENRRDWSKEVKKVNKWLNSLDDIKGEERDDDEYDEDDYV